MRKRSHKKQYKERREEGKSVKKITTTIAIIMIKDKENEIGKTEK